jgi:Flp pilus assembly protein TadG
MSQTGTYLRRFAHDDNGATVVELAIIVPLLMLLTFGVLDYGRLFWIESMAQKATSIAARTAAVRPPVCPGVPETISLAASAPNDGTVKFGTLCRAGGICANGGTQTCALDTTTASGLEIWNRIAPLMPPGSTPANVQVSYSFDGRIGFLGGPYSPVVTAELVGLTFQFASPLGSLGAIAASDASVSASLGSTILLPNMSVSMPGEDLASGVSN